MDEVAEMIESWRIASQLGVGRRCIV